MATFTFEQTRMKMTADNYLRGNS